MTKEKSKKLPITSTLGGLAVGEMAAFPLHRLNSVKNSCSIKKITDGLVFSTHMNHETKMIEVTRIS